MIFFLIKLYYKENLLLVISKAKIIINIIKFLFHHLLLILQDFDFNQFIN